MGKADLHVHTCHDAWGDGNDDVATIFDHVQNHTDLDLLGITDHDSTQAARAGRELQAAGDYRFDFLPGTEVTTTSGHVLCYFPGEIHDVPSLRSLHWTGRFVHERGGICVLAHPVFPPWLRHSLLNSDGRVLMTVDATEVMNGGLSPRAQARLDSMGAQLPTTASVVGNSDAHQKESIGSVWTEFPGRSLQDFLLAVQQRKTKPRRGAAVPMPREARSFTRRRSMTRPGWVRNVYREVTHR